MNTKTGQSAAASTATPASVNAPSDALKARPQNPLKKNVRAAAAAEQPTQEVPEPTLGDFVESATPLSRYRMQENDIGFTAGEIGLRLKGETAELTPLEEKILDGLLFQNFYEQTFRIGSKATFTLRTVGARAMHSTPIVLTKLSNADPVLKGRLTSALEAAVVVARMLVEFNGRRTCEFETQRDFESTEALEARLDFVMDLPLALVNIIGDRSNAMTNMVREAVKRDTSNFS